MDAAKDGQNDPVVAPAALSEAQRAVWQDTVAAVSGPWTAHRQQLLEAYAVERARWLESEAYLREHGAVLVLRNERGEVRQAIEAPQVKIAARAQDRMLKLGGLLGLG